MGSGVKVYLVHIDRHLGWVGWGWEGGVARGELIDLVVVVVVVLRVACGRRECVRPERVRCVRALRACIACLLTGSPLLLLPGDVHAATGSGALCCSAMYAVLVLLLHRARASMLLSQRQHEVQMMRFK